MSTIIIAIVLFAFIALVVYKNSRPQSKTIKMLLTSWKKETDSKNNKWLNELVTINSKHHNDGFNSSTVMSVNKTGAIEYITVEMVTATTFNIRLNSKIISTSFFNTVNECVSGEQIHAKAVKVSKMRGNLRMASVWTGPRLAA